jgi:hypothetical protein
LENIIHLKIHSVVGTLARLDLPINKESIALKNISCEKKKMSFIILFSRLAENKRAFMIFKSRHLLMETIQLCMLQIYLFIQYQSAKQILLKVLLHGTKIIDLNFQILIKIDLKCNS